MPSSMVFLGGSFGLTVKVLVQCDHFHIRLITYSGSIKSFELPKPLNHMMLALDGGKSIVGLGFT